MSSVIFELKGEAEADVVRGCCGGNHEFGECPLENKNVTAPASDDTENEDDENVVRGENAT